MSASNSLETAILQLFFNATTYNLIAENDSTSPATNLYVSLHTADPGEAGTAVTNETDYTNYARVEVARTSGGWTVSGNAVTNAATVTFPACGVTGATITHFGVVSTASGAGELYFSGTASLSVSSGVTPEFAIGALSVTAD